jgi:hypothetical protein
MSVVEEMRSESPHKIVSYSASSEKNKTVVE